MIRVLYGYFRGTAIYKGTIQGAIRDLDLRALSLDRVLWLNGRYLRMLLSFSCSKDSGRKPNFQNHQSTRLVPVFRFRV